MPGTTRKTDRRTFRVLVSHDGMNEGEIVRAEPEDFGRMEHRLSAGYVEELKSEVAGDAGQREGGES